MTALHLSFKDSMLFVDAMLYEEADYISDYTAHELWAISVLGNEQVVRQFVASCVDVPHSRPFLYVRGPNKTVRCRYAPPKWWCRAKRVGASNMHLICMPPPVQHPDPNVTTHLMIPRPGIPTDHELYAMLLRRYTTPLVPIGVSGQPQEEAEIGEIWRNIVSANVRAKYTTALRPHPEQPDQQWRTARLLKMKDEQLDELVGDLLRNGVLPLEAACITG